LRRRGAALAAAFAVLALSSCGGDDEETPEELRVSAAASLTAAFEAYAEDLPETVRYSFAGSDELAAQIRQGAKPDVFASANTSLPEALHEEGLVAEPVEFATNELVIATPTDSEIDSIEDLEQPGLDLVIGTPDVPFGSYTREVLDRLPAAERESILANVRSEESDVTAAVGKLLQGAADASFVYRSDITGAAGELRAVALPAELQPTVVYGIAAVDGAENPAGAERFIDRLLDGPGQDTLADAGFGPPPG
jgi:molybdate transport system substrate-binding protein